MISIIIPTLEEEATLGRTLKSLRTLDRSSYEVIVSDGNSQDATLEIARKYADNVIQCSGHARQTIAHGRNTGAGPARGEFVVFLDADSWLENPAQFFSEALSEFSAHPDLVGITAVLKVHPEKATRADKLIFGLVNLTNRVKNNMLRMGEAPGEFQMIRTSAFRAVHGFREDLVSREDADMFRRLSRIGQTKLCSQLVVFHSGRRAHMLGWPRLLMTWMLDTIWVTLFDRALSKEWKVVR